MRQRHNSKHTLKPWHWGSIAHRSGVSYQKSSPSTILHYPNATKQLHAFSAFITIISCITKTPFIMTRSSLTSRHITEIQGYGNTLK
jgi:hypothetical protein